MAGFKYVGDSQGHGPETVTAFGVTFPKGTTVTVEDDFVIGKLTGNSHFTEVKRGRPPASDGAAGGNG
jgi:hypothetical protein